MNDENDITPDFRFRPSRDVPEMLIFKSAFPQLCNILSHNQAPSFTPPTTSSIITSPTQTIVPDLQDATSVSRLPFSSNLRYSSESSESNESGPEASLNSFAIVFLKAIFFSIETVLDRTGWYRLGDYSIRLE